MLQMLQTGLNLLFLLQVREEMVLYHLDVPYDFSYNNTAAYTGGTDGSALGDPNWQSGNTTGIANEYINSNNFNVYPNPLTY